MEHLGTVVVHLQEISNRTVPVHGPRKKPEYLFRSIATYLGVCWDSVAFNFWWNISTGSGYLFTINNRNQAPAKILQVVLRSQQRSSKQICPGKRYQWRDTPQWLSTRPAKATVLIILWWGGRSFIDQISSNTFIQGRRERIGRIKPACPSKLTSETPKILIRMILCSPKRYQKVHVSHWSWGV